MAEAIINSGDQSKKHHKNKSEKDKTPKAQRVGSATEPDKSADDFQKQVLNAERAKATTALLKRRVFTKTECSSTSIKLQWEHFKDT